MFYFAHNIKKEVLVCNMKTSNLRDPYWDIVKSIGIISIVIGHASWTIGIWKWNIEIGGFVYLYHLAIFFFCSGYLYNDKTADWLEYVKKKIKALYFPFVQYSVLWLIVRNICIKIGILDGHIFSFGENIIYLTNILTFNSIGEFLAAFWFLPVMFFSMCIYAFVTILCNKLPEVYSPFARIIACLIIGAIGVFTTESNYGLLYNMQIAYLMIPIIECGQLARRFPPIRLNWMVVVLCLVSAFLLGCVIYFHIGYIELSKYQIINHWLFYPVTFTGIAFCLTLAKIISWLGLSSVFSYIGKHSFEIMALHFLGIKIVDLVICTIFKRPEDMAMFPHTFNNIWLLYYIVGVSFPLLCVKAYTYIKSNLMKRIEK